MFTNNEINDLMKSITSMAHSLKSIDYNIKALVEIQEKAEKQRTLQRTWQSNIYLMQTGLDEIDKSAEAAEAGKEVEVLTLEVQELFDNFLALVENDGIDSSKIHGRANKAAFDYVLNTVQRLKECIVAKDAKTNDSNTD